MKKLLQIRPRLPEFWLSDGIYPVLILVIMSIGILIFTTNAYFITIATLALIYFIAALGYNLVLTHAGLFHFGFACHFAIGGYIGAILLVKFGFEFIPTLLIVLLITGLTTLLMALPVLRFAGDYLAVVTLALAEIVRQVLINWQSVTNGSLGISGIPTPNFFGFTSIQTNYLFIITVGVAILALFAYQTIVTSRFGLIWEAIRLNQDAALASGLRIYNQRLVILVVSSLFAGVAGLIYAHYATIVDPSMSSVDVTILLMIIVILGANNWLGILLACIVFTALPQFLLSLNIYRQLFLGLFLVFIMNLQPGGLSFIKRRMYARIQRKPSGSNKEEQSWHISSIDSLPTKVHITKEPIKDYFALDVRGLTKKYGGVVAVDQLSMQVPVGALYGIIGPNGAGKTTLFNLVSGFIKPDDGSIYILDHEVTKWEPWRISRIGVGRTFQNLKIFDTLSVLDNVLVSASLRSLNKPIDRDDWVQTAKKAYEALEFVGLEKYSTLSGGSLPHGDQRRLEIARAIVSQPRLLLLDEPAAGLNPVELENLKRLVKSIQNSGVTVVCIEHNMRFILQIADMVFVMAEGRCLLVDQPEKVAHDSKVIEAYLGRRAISVAS
jgi:branched-chain amino acid transport system ATP-binding protein/branched-chain amino acid transport system permease protein